MICFACHIQVNDVDFSIRMEEPPNIQQRHVPIWNVPLPPLSTFLLIVLKCFIHRIQLYLLHCIFMCSLQWCI